MPQRQSIGFCPFDLPGALLFNVLWTSTFLFAPVIPCLLLHVVSVLCPCSCYPCSLCVLYFCRMFVACAVTVNFGGFVCFFILQFTPVVFSYCLISKFDQVYISPPGLASPVYCMCEDVTQSGAVKVIFTIHSTADGVHRCCDLNCE